MKKIEEFGDIYINYNNHIEKYLHNSENERILKIITYKELLGVILAGCDDDSIDYFYKEGLDRSINKISTISLLTTSYKKNKSKKKLLSYDFSNKNEKTNELVFDIPYFHRDIPEGFSVFCTDEENRLINEYINNKKIKSQEKKEKNKEEYITDEPLPNKTNFICQLCRKRYDNYKEHINSDEHKLKKKLYKNSYIKLSNTFKRIAKENSKLKNKNYNKKNDKMIKTIGNQFSNVSTLFSSQQDINFSNGGIINNENQSYNLRNKKKKEKNEFLIHRIPMKRKRSDDDDFIFDDMYKNLRNRNYGINLGKNDKINFNLCK